MYIISQGMMLWREVFVLEWFSPNFITDVYQVIGKVSRFGLHPKKYQILYNKFGCRLVNENLGGWSQVVACFSEMSITRVLQLDMFLHRDGHLFWPKNCWMFGYLLVHNKRRSTSQKSQFRHCHHSKWLFLGFRIDIFWKSSRRNKATETFSAAMIQDNYPTIFELQSLVQIGYPGPQEVLVVHFVFENHGGQPTKPSKSISFPSRRIILNSD